MKKTRARYAAVAVTLAAAGYVMASGHNGWGWLLFAALLLLANDD